MSRSGALQITYGILAVVGVALPWWFNWQYMQANPGGFNAGHFVREAMTTAAGSSLTVDIGLVGIAAGLFMWFEARRLTMKIGPVNIAIPLMVYSLCIAVASGLPLFLLLRERRLQQLKEGVA